MLFLYGDDPAVPGDPTGALGVLVIILLESDLPDLRSGRSKTIIPAHLQGRKFGQVVLSLAKDKPTAIADLKRVGKKVTEGDFVHHDPKLESSQGECEGCHGVMEKYMLHLGHCVICWREKAEHYRLEYLELAKGNR